jgi:hypothetical protein
MWAWSPGSHSAGLHRSSTKVHLDLIRLDLPVFIDDVAVRETAALPCGRSGSTSALGLGFRRSKLCRPGLSHGNKARRVGLLLGNAQEVKDEPARMLGMTGFSGDDEALAGRQ